MIGGMGGQNTVSVLVRLTGAQQVQAQMAQLTASMRGEASKATGAAGTAALAAAGRIAAVGTAMAAAGKFALEGYSNFRRFETGLQALVGNGAGSRLARDVQAFGLASAYSTGEVQNMAQMMLAMGSPVDSLMGRMKSMAALVAVAGGSTEQFARAGVQLAQIQSLGKVQGQDIRALSQSFPVQLIAKAAGVQSPMQLSGMSSERFFAAMDKAAKGLGDVQAKMLRENPFQRFQNMMEGAQAALMPVGRMVNTALQPFFKIGEWAVGAVGAVAKTPPGAIGLAIVGIGAFALGIRAVFKDLMLLRAGLMAASQAAIQNAAAQGGAAVGTTFFGRALGQGAGMAVGGKAVANVVGKRGAGWFGKRIGGKLAGAGAANAIPVAGQAISLALLAWTIYDVIKMGGEIKDEFSKISKQSSPTPAMQPTQRSDIENMQLRLMTSY